MINQTFQQVVGHERQKQYFSELLASQKAGHAYCLKGAAGIGKRYFAMQFLREMMCCGNRADYVKFDTSNHPDYLAIINDGTILSDQINSIRQFVYKKPLISPIKAILIDDAANMNEQAQNKILKILEEPPGHVLMLFITNRPNQLLPTVLSRLTHIGFNPLTTEQVDQLIERHNLTRDNRLIGISAGSFGIYQRLKCDEQFAQLSEKTVQVLLSGLKGSNQWLLESDLLNQYKDNSAHLFYLMRAVLRDLLVYSKTNRLTALKILNSADVANIDNKTINQVAIYDMIREINRAESALQRGQNYSLLMETLLFNIEEALHG